MLATAGAYSLRAPATVAGRGCLPRTPGPAATWPLARRQPPRAPRGAGWSRGCRPAPLRRVGRESEQACDATLPCEARNGAGRYVGAGVSAADVRFPAGYGCLRLYPPGNRRSMAAMNNHAPSHVPASARCHCGRTIVPNQAGGWFAPHSVYPSTACELGGNHAPATMRVAAGNVRVGDRIVGALRTWNVVAVEVAAIDWDAPTPARAGTVAVTMAHPDDAATQTTRRFRSDATVEIVAR